MLHCNNSFRVRNPLLGVGLIGWVEVGKTDTTDLHRKTAGFKDLLEILSENYPARTFLGRFLRSFSSVRTGRNSENTEIVGVSAEVSHGATKLRSPEAQESCHAKKINGYVYPLLRKSRVFPGGTLRFLQFVRISP